MMGLFNEIRQRVPIRVAAEFYGLRFDRYGKGKCPFHHDEHPSLSVKNGRYRCWSCGASGSVLDLVMQLLGYSSIIDAAKRLDDDFSLGLFTSDTILPLDREKIRQDQAEMEHIQMFKEWLDFMRPIYAIYLRTIRRAMEVYRPFDPEIEVDEHYVNACHLLDETENTFNTVFMGGADFRDQLAFFESLRRKANS